MIRLNKVARDLNVGIQTLIDFLQKNGYADETFTPNTQISDDQYALLQKEFNADKSVKEGADKMSQVRHHKEKPVQRKVEQEPELVNTEEIKRPQFKQVGKIDLDAVNKRPAPKPAPVEKKEEVKPVPVEKKAEQPQKVEVKKEEIKPAPVEKKEEVKPVPVEKKAEQPQKVEVKKEEVKPAQTEVFDFSKPQASTQLNIVGKIDLDSLNQKTRPQKKSKEERQKEREEKERQRNEMFKRPAQNQEKGEGERKKRQRIKKDKIDINNPNVQPAEGGKKQKPQKVKQPRPVRVEVSEEDVQRQVKETLARLTSKNSSQKKGAKWRKEKREANLMREQELANQERLESKILKITEFVTANDLATMMGVEVNKVISTCMSIGMMVSINQRLDAETINIVAEEFGFKTEYVSAEVVSAIEQVEDKEEDLVSRPPIVTVMGHVDHGKTSLLDYIRNANVIAGEAGGITQHIGAYNVKLDDGRRITFLDTPGHEAFTAMRARGAQVTDIAIIIVAADDNVMPQTVEAINHAAAAGVPIVFAINKIDKPTANPDKIKEALAAMNYLVEDWGGKYQSQDISAKKGMGVEDLLEKVLLEAEMLELKANPKAKARGSIIESALDKGRGYVSTVLVENGTLKVGDIVVAGQYYGRVKAMFNERNGKIKEAGPAAPALILGFNGAPQAGDTFNVFDTEQEARELANKREQLQREQGFRTSTRVTLEEIGRRIAIGNFQQLNIVVKADVDGSVEALSDSLIRLSTEQIQVNVIHKGVGQISESDVTLAAASDAIIVGFNVRPSLAARKDAEKEGVDIRLYSIIYDAIEEVKSAMEGMLSPEIKEVITATVEVRETFHISKVGTVAGGAVKEGKIKRGNKVRLIRDGIVIYTGELASLKRMKDDVKEVATGYECGLSITNYNDIKVGDIIESFEEVEVKQTL
ncbi:MAG: translation initiation factor IF-2 [Bacteroidales bacterium]|nr:translation initiation factor IF-2 [Bacteroidales bacterium]